MMQQQLYQQEQPVTQDASGHQMVLCPVRLVYETQMLVQPGEQLQPNQTIFINPQNPPPWIQNRPVQNQVIYVQQMPTNYVQPQQHIDPNQLYIQNYGYQNIPPMLVQNPQEQIRPMHMIQQNIGPTAQIGPTVQTQRLIPNVNPISNTINLVNAAQSQNVTMNRPIAQNQITNISELVNNVNMKQENISQNIYRPVGQTMPQDPRNQLQQTVTLVPTIRTPNQMYEPNIGQVQPMPTQNIANVQPTYQNTMVNLQDTRKLSMPINKTSNYSIVQPNTAVKGPQTFRPIQPRAAQIRNNGPQFQLSVQPAPASPSASNIVNINNVPRKMVSTKTVQIPAMSITNSTKSEANSITINRKRKSESPDEIQKKLSISNTVESPIIIKKIENVSTNTVNCSDVGVNTSPIHKPDARLAMSNIQITPINPNNQNLTIKEELAKKLNYPVPDIPLIIRSDMPNPILNISSEKDKLIRNTVFTQARGRVLTDKEPVIEINRVEVTPNNALNNTVSNTGTVNTVTNTVTVNTVSNAVTVNTVSNTVTINTVSNTANSVNNTVKTTNHIVKPINNPVPSISTEVEKPLNSDNSKELEKPEAQKESETAVASMVTEKSPEKTENKEQESVKKVTKTENSTGEIKLKKDRDFILTHVLDGYVIQESNIAFPIRKPLKEKVLPNNSGKSDTKNENKEVKNDRDSGVKNNSKILNISHLHINDIEVKNNDHMDIDKDNPFHALQPVTVKLWTAEQLATHLSKFGWDDTVSVLQEHEIDGESLLLVSKGQLLTIGIKEEHAEIINEFVKS